jgi:hypothetical protein
MLSSYPEKESAISHTRSVTLDLVVRLFPFANELVHATLQPLVLLSVPRVRSFHLVRVGC